jgi:mono/diheme cytochrome c family protein
MFTQVTFRLAATISFAGLAVLTACHSSDLGSKKPDRVNVDVALASWDGGAGKVITQKCANCHTSARSRFVPDNTPHDLDGIESLDFFMKPENRGIAKMMRKRIESTDATRQMPPKFATPLYEDEKTVVLAFLKTIEDGQSPSNPCPKPMGLVSLMKRGHDDADDGDDDDDGRHEPGDDDNGQPEPGDDDNTTPRPQPGQGDGSVVTDPCSQPNPNPNPNPNPTVTFNDVVAIVKANCASCHNGTSNFSLQTREDFVAKKPFPLNEIMSGSMPLRNPGFKDTADGKLLIQWLQGPQTE